MEGIFFDKVLSKYKKLCWIFYIVGYMCKAPIITKFINKILNKQVESIVFD